MAPLKGYIVVNVDVHDHDTYARYRERARPIVEKFGGRYLVRGAKLETLEGDFGLERFVILEFPSLDAARNFYESSEYREVRRLRHDSASSDMVLVEGYE